MYSLIFDTTAASCSIVLGQNDKIIADFSREMDFGQSEELIVRLKDMLTANHLKFTDIGAVFVCTGPGSFTGVRASISAAKVFALTSPELIVSGFSAFDAYILDLSPSEISTLNAVIIETRRDDFYVRFYDEHLCPTCEPQALSREEIIAVLKSHGRAVSLIGDGLARFLSQPSGLVLQGIKLCNYLPTSALFKAARQQLVSKKFNFPKPLYLRPADVTMPKNI
ncbi:MAG: tRNA (adenosine(37)-N6)-threonylcarbamoyltransferase complex dimerization subunit type 1 TsaB [Alphaproteobacteria bacterium]|nr:tRNA (adenosine(37)-N6)-threonylcarbamoyltransferase complex dimerization subunit type 1 TsaB [Alphaproteobacteria bacterium]